MVGSFRAGSIRAALLGATPLGGAGLAFACGLAFENGFYDERPTLLHVSRGTASLLPLRLNCPPEITKLVLHAE